MSPEELSNTFDVLYNNITSNQAPGLSEYEKSIFLTKAEEEIVKNHFMPMSKGNNIGLGFDDSAKRQADFSTILRSQDCTEIEITSSLIDKRSHTYNYPDDVFIVINESIYTKDYRQIQVVPISYPEYLKQMSKPFKRPLKNQAWKLINVGSTKVTQVDEETQEETTSTVEVRYVELITNIYDHIDSYTVRYVKKPKPVITGDLDGLTINGYAYGSNATAAIPETEGCELDSSLHEEILQRAVELAKIAWLGDVNTSMTAGQRSE